MFIFIAFLSVVLIICTVYGKLLSEADRKQRALHLNTRIKDIGMPNFPISQGIPIFYNGIVNIIGAPTDPEFNVVTMD